EQDGDLLALALEGGLGGEDFLGQMLRGVTLGGGEAGSPRRLRRSGRKRCPATIAEPAPGLCLGAAAGADRGRRRAALPAEARAVTVLGMAPGTGHDRGGPPPPWSLALSPSG